MPANPYNTSNIATSERSDAKPLAFTWRQLFFAASLTLSVVFAASVLLEQVVAVHSILNQGSHHFITGVVSVVNTWKIVPDVIFLKWIISCAVVAFAAMPHAVFTLMVFIPLLRWTCRRKKAPAKLTKQ